MDYQGNYFPEEQDENSSKTYRTIKGVFKWTMYGLSFVLYAVLFYILFINRDSDILETNYMHSLPEYENADTESFDLYRINTKIFMNDDGSLQLYNVDYSNKYNLLEIGVKFNAKKLTNGDRGDCLTYKLTDNDGKEYTLVNIVSDSGGRYGFSRICFTDVNIDLDSNDLRYDKEKSDVPRAEKSYKLSVYRNADRKLLFEFDLYDNTVTFAHTDYED